MLGHVKSEKNSAKQSCSPPQEILFSSSSSDESEDGQDYREIVLGFAEPVENRSIFHSCKFPSKLGGLPVWLYGNNNRPKAFRCGQCNAVLAFLLQLYAPIDEFEHSFHRMLYIFICRSRGCKGGSRTVRVLRGQLPRRNPYYTFSSNLDLGGNDTVDGYNTVMAENACLCASDEGDHDSNSRECALCGCDATAKCGRCSMVWYCSRDCQKQDWTLGHREECGKPAEELGTADRKCDMPRKRSGWRFKEFEIAHEPCPTPKDQSDSETTGATKNTKSNIVTALSSSGKISQALGGSMQDVSEDELPESLFRQGVSGPGGKPRLRDKAFQNFSDALSCAPSQILRYWRGGRALWPCKISQHSKELDALQSCSRCGGPLVFEFQLLPQLLHYIGVDDQCDLKSDAGGCGSLDWGTIAVYTCHQSCAHTLDNSNTKFNYYEEAAIVLQLDGTQ